MLVSIDDPLERERVEALAARLGIDGVLVDGRLRHVGAACVFLDVQGACRIHAAFGAQAKPATCQQFPLVLLETEGGPRAGIDPCCYHAHRQAADAPVLDLPRLLPRRVSFDPARAADESSLVTILAAESASLGGLLARVQGTAVPGADGVPRGVASAWIRCLQQARLERFLDPDIAGDALRRSLGPAFALIPRLDPVRPPPWPAMQPAAEAQVLAALHALVWLRLCNTAIPAVRDVITIGSLGAVLLAWHDPEALAVGAGLAGWFRLMRAPQFSQALLMGGPRAARS